MNIRLSEQQKNDSYTSPEYIAQLMHCVLLRENRLSRSQEHFWVMGLNNANQLLYIELIGLGRQNSVAVNPPDVFRTALHRLALKIVRKLDRLLREHKEKELVRETQYYTRLLIAKKLKETGMDAAGISKLTSLRLPELREL